MGKRPKDWNPSHTIVFTISQCEYPMSQVHRSLSYACRSWLASCERNGLERSTLKACRSHVNIHIEPRTGGLLLTNLKRADIRGFMGSLLDDGVSRALVKKIMVSLRSLLSEAVEREWIAHNVAADVKLKRQSHRASDDRIIPKGRDPDHHREGAGLASSDVRYRDLQRAPDL